MLKLLTPAANRDLTSLAAVKSELGIVDGNEDLNLARWITAASAVIENHCRRVFAEQTYEETFYSAAYVPELTLAQYPVSEVTSIVENGVTLGESDAEANPDSGILTRIVGDRPAYWACGKIVVTYIAGFAVDDLPAAIGQAAIRLVAMFRSGANRDPLVKGVSIPGVMETSYWVGGLGDAGLPPDVLALLAPYRSHRAH